MSTPRNEKPVQKISASGRNPRKQTASEPRPPRGDSPSRGRPRDPQLASAILATAEQHLRELGYGGLSIEGVAKAAGTTVPTLRRRYPNKQALVAAVIDAMRVEPLRNLPAAPRERTLAILENFRRNLGRAHSMALLGTLLTEEARNPALLARFRARLVKGRRTQLAEALADGIAAGQLPSETDLDLTVSMLIGSFYARYISHGQIPRDWPGRLVREIWTPLS